MIELVALLALLVGVFALVEAILMVDSVAVAKREKGGCIRNPVRFIERIGQLEFSPFRMGVTRLQVALLVPLWAIHWIPLFGFAKRRKNS